MIVLDTSLYLRVFCNKEVLALNYEIRRELGETKDREKNRHSFCVVNWQGVNRLYSDLSFMFKVFRE